MSNLEYFNCKWRLVENSLKVSYPDVKDRISVVINSGYYGQHKGYRCGGGGYSKGRGHFSGRGKSVLSDTICFNCGQAGHIKVQCWVNLVIVIMVEAIVNSVSVISDVFVQKLGYCVNNCDVVSILSANGQSVNVLGSVLIALPILKFTLHKFYVVSNLESTVILGSDFLHRNRVVIDYANNKLIVNNAPGAHVFGLFGKLHYGFKAGSSFQCSLSPVNKVLCNKLVAKYKALFSKNKWGANVSPFPIDTTADKLPCLKPICIQIKTLWR